MKLWSRTRKAVRNQTQEIHLDSSLEELAEFFGWDTDAPSSNRLTAATYYACMLIRCNALAKLPFKVMRESTEKGAEVQTNHTLHNLLRMRPNPYTSAHDFKWATEYQRLEYGNAYWVMDYTNGRPKAIYLLDSPRVTIMVDDVGLLQDRNAVYYVYTDAKQGTIIYTEDEIVHFKNFALNGIKGNSIKKYLADEIENEQYSTGILKKRYKTGLQDPIVVQYTGDFNKENRVAIQRKFETLGGAQNAGRVVPIPTEFSVSQLETKLVNSQFFQLQGLTTRKIANAFGVKSFQLNDMERSTYTNIEQQNKAFYSDTLQNVVTAYEEEMTWKMLPEREKKDRYYIQANVDAILRSDLESRTKAYASAIESGWKSRAEVRKLEGLPYVEGTDILTVGNGATIPLTDLGKQYAGKGVSNE
nr:MAG TPA: portal protein [Caudoviricetes sp.]